MVTVNELIDRIIRREGGWVDHPQDRGGATNWGVTIGTLSAWRGRRVSKAEVRALSKAEAREIFRAVYWDRPGLNRLPESITDWAFDTSVLHGPGRAIEFLADVCHEAGFGRESSRTPVSAGLVRAAFEADREMGMWLVSALCDRRAQSYYGIVARSPSQRVFLKGWINRVNGLRPKAAALALFEAGHADLSSDAA